MVTAFFGGSFDPPHSGHLAVARGVLASRRCGEVVWVPAFAPPHKLGRSRAAFSDRLAMVKLLIAGEAQMDVSDIEARVRLSPSYTIDILAAYEAETGIRPALLIGGDSLAELHLWHECRRLVSGYEILTYPRRGAEVTAEFLAHHWSKAEREKLLAGVLEGKFFEISSSKLRNSMEKNGLTGHIKEETETSPEVLTYIRRRGLYAAGADLEGKRVEKMKSDEMKTAAVEPKALAEFCISCAEEKMAENPVMMDLSGVSSVADYFIVATANSEPQLHALTGFIERQVREKYQLRTFSQGGTEIGGWVLLDFGTVIVHLMTPEMREKYNLEALWGEQRKR